MFESNEGRKQERKEGSLAKLILMTNLIFLQNSIFLQKLIFL
jgi:hypothetical protein